MEQRNLPVIQDLYANDDLAVLKKDNDLNILLNQEPKVTWIKKHPLAKKTIIDVNGEKKQVPIDYIPIERIEWLLTRIFVLWQVEVKDVKLIGNSVVVTVRLWYKHPVSGEWMYHDGVGATPLQVNSGKPATDWNEIKSNAVQIAAPAAESYAVKDAAEKLGKLFGKDLNRADEIGYDMLVNSFAPDMKSEVMLATEKIIKALDTYKGADCEQIKKQTAKKLRDGTLTIEYLKDIAKKIGVEL